MLQYDLFFLSIFHSVNVNGPKFTFYIHYILNHLSANILTYSCLHVLYFKYIVSFNTYFAIFPGRYP